MPKVIGYDPVDLGFGGMINYAGIDNNVVLDDVKDGDYPIVVLADSNFSSVSLLLDGEDFTDHGPIGNTVTKTGSVPLVTGKFGNAYSFVGSTSNIISSPDSTAYDLAGTNWTLECWVNFNSVSAWQILFGHGATGGNNTGWLIDYTGSNLRFFWKPISISQRTDYVVSWSPSTSQWYHVAITRESGVVYMFVDGSLLATHSATTNDVSNATGDLVVGRRQDSIRPLNAKIEEIRITKGVARYTQAFTPNTLEFPQS